MPIFNKPTKIEKLWASNGDMSPPPDDSKIATGFIVEIPTLEQFNYIENKQDAMLAHLNQRGTAEYDVNTNYLAGKSYVQAPSGIIYVAKLDNGPETIVVAPEGSGSSPTYWKKAFYFTDEAYTSAQTTALFTSKAANLSDLPNVNTARVNLSVYSKAETDNKYPTKANNLTDLANGGTAFNNIKQYSAEGFSGVINIATDAQASAGSDNTVAITPRKLRLGFSLTVGTMGQISFPTWLGGLIIQWGTQSVNANSTANAALSRSFPSSCFMGVVSIASSNVSTDLFAPKAYAFATNFILVNTGPTENFSWIAIGN